MKELRDMVASIIETLTAVKKGIFIFKRPMTISLFNATQECRYATILITPVE